MEDACFDRKAEEQIIILDRKTHAKQHDPPSVFAKHKPRRDCRVDQTERVEVHKDVLVQVLQLPIAEETNVTAFMSDIQAFP